MTDPSLLPPNATPFMRAMEAAPAFAANFAPIELMVGAKFDPPDSWLPYLLYEYGLGELLPYLDDPRRAIREGVLWQRARGTAAALKTAAGWIDINPAVEETTDEWRWWGLQIDPARILSDREAAALIGVARLSLPARSRLQRAHHGWDWRAGRYDSADPRRTLWDDWSGVDYQGVRLSFGDRIAVAGGAGDGAGCIATATPVVAAGFHADAAIRWDLSLLDGGSEASPRPPAMLVLYGWVAPSPADLSPPPHWWMLPRVSLHDGVAWDGLHGVTDGYAVPVGRGDPAWDAARFDAASTWGWLSFGARAVDQLAATPLAPPPAPFAAPAALLVITAVGVADATVAAALQIAIAVAPPASGQPWGGGPWLDQPWGAASAAVGMEMMN